LPRRLLVDVPGETLQERVVDDALVERRVLATTVFTRVVDEELTLGDGGGAEGVRLDDVGAGLEKAPVDVADHRRLGQREQIAVVQQVFAGLAEPFAANVGLGHPIGADGRAHGAVDDRDALCEHILKGMAGRHGGGRGAGMRVGGDAWGHGRS
jgi:hypothetical protein